MTPTELVQAWRRRADELQDYAPAAARAFQRAADELVAAVPNAGELLAPSTSPPAATDWRERIWTCDENVRLGVRDVAAAIGRPKSWVYRHTSRKSGYSIIPHTKLDGELTFRVGDVRAWLSAVERGESIATRQAGVHVLPMARRKTSRRGA